MCMFGNRAAKVMKLSSEINEKMKNEKWKKSNLNLLEKEEAREDGLNRQTCEPGD